MSVAMPSHRIGSEPFALLARIFNGLKRRGRVIDVLWFQQSAEYARAVLALADECDDDEVRKMGASLRTMLGAYVAPPVALIIPESKTAAAAASPIPAVAVPADSPISTESITAMQEPSPASPPLLDDFENRYVGRLR